MCTKWNSYARFLWIIFVLVQRERCSLCAVIYCVIHSQAIWRSMNVAHVYVYSWRTLWSSHYMCYNCRFTIGLSQPIQCVCPHSTHTRRSSNVAMKREREREKTKEWKKRRKHTNNSCTSKRCLWVWASIYVYHSHIQLERVDWRFDKDRIMNDCTRVTVWLYEIEIICCLCMRQILMGLMAFLCIFS